MIVHDYYAQVLARQRIEEAVLAAERAAGQRARPTRRRIRIPRPVWQRLRWTATGTPQSL